MRISAAHFRTKIRGAFDVDGDRLRKAKAKAVRGPRLFGPAWVDLQCNGFAGIDFNHPATTPEQICFAVRSMWKTGCGVVLPTIITNDPERIEHLLRTVVKARQSDREVADSVPAIHLEGPFISPEDGARGAHPREHVCKPKVALWQKWQRAAEGLIRMVTLAPERPGAQPFIKRMVSEGVIAAIGHTMATAAQVREAAAAGARISTHLGNGCPIMLPRHENPILAQLAEDRLAATFITDGIHLPPHVVRSFVRAKTVERSIVVTDAMAAAGAPPGRYTLANHTLEVGRDRVVRQPGQATFAGSALTMDAAVANFAAYTGESLAEAWIAGSTRPASVMGVRIRATVVADFVDGRLVPVALFRAGRVLWKTTDLA